MKQKNISARAALRLIAAVLSLFIFAISVGAQERRTKLRISNPTLTFTALPFIVAREWNFFFENGIENFVKAVKSQGRFVERKVAFEDVADDSLAREVAKQMGYKID